jgi:hypothetical protein
VTTAPDNEVSQLPDLPTAALRCTIPREDAIMIAKTAATVAAATGALLLAAPAPAFAAEQTKTLHIRVIDQETGKKVAGECNVSTDVGTFSFIETNAGGQASVTLGADATTASIFCGTGAGSGSTSVTLRENGATNATVFV